MRSPFLSIILALAFSSVAFAQGETKIKFDVRPGLSENSNLAGLTRTRTVTSNAAASLPASHLARDLERRVFELLNAERRSKGVPVLDWSDDVAALARLHSQNMADGKFFSHRGTDGSMVDDRADRLGLGEWRMIGENIAYMRGYDDPATLAIEKWMESTAHRKNLLGSNWKESAVGVAITADGTYYMTQVFLLRK
jgi:uncharacterized protein YkwD